MKFLIPREESTGEFRQNRLLAIFGGYLEFLRKCKDMFISEMEQVRVILTKLLSHRDICRVYW